MAVSDTMTDSDWVTYLQSKGLKNVLINRNAERIAIMYTGGETHYPYDGVNVRNGDSLTELHMLSPLTAAGADLSKVPQLNAASLSAPNKARLSTLQGAAR